MMMMMIVITAMMTTIIDDDDVDWVVDRERINPYKIPIVFQFFFNIF